MVPSIQLNESQDTCFISHKDGEQTDNNQNTSNKNQ